MSKCHPVQVRRNAESSESALQLDGTETLSLLTTYLQKQSSVALFYVGAAAVEWYRIPGVGQVGCREPLHTLETGVMHGGMPLA
jgi:hypothetical protein